MSKGRPTPRDRWECKVNGKWLPARDRGHRPRVGGQIVTRYHYFGKITEVRRADDAPGAKRRARKAAKV